MMYFLCVFRMDLIAQYSQLSEAAARRELRAMWKVQRMKLDERRVNFLQQEQQNVQVWYHTFFFIVVFGPFRFFAFVKYYF